MPKLILVEILHNDVFAKFQTILFRFAGARICKWSCVINLRWSVGAPFFSLCAFEWGARTALGSFKRWHLKNLLHDSPRGVKNSSNNIIGMRLYCQQQAAARSVSSLSSRPGRPMNVASFFARAAFIIDIKQGGGTQHTHSHKRGSAQENV